MKRETISLQTHARTDFVRITDMVQKAVTKMGVNDGLCTLYVPHTTAGVFINEGYDPDVMRDLEHSLDRQVPWRDDYLHSEGNAAAHIKAILVGNTQQVLVEEGRLLLGRWEEIFFAEFDGSRTRQLIVSVIDNR
ncbi:MAG: secondary thiamine-phosphate synthase enzyme YjbQ [bacterium]|nr:secondary thiamine-phosphate synthase enzyme YjbQ [bacterium]